MTCIDASDQSKIGCNSKFYDKYGIIINELNKSGIIIKKENNTNCLLGSLCKLKKIKRKELKYGAKKTLREYVKKGTLKLKGKTVNNVVNVNTAKKIDNFLSSWEWRTLRYKILIKYGSRCMCCGMTPNDGAKICVDHIKPRAKYPEKSLEENNLQILCDVCNQGKGAWDETDFRIGFCTQPKPK